MTKTVRVFVVTVLLLIGSVVWGSGASAHNNGKGTVQVVLAAPADVPGSVIMAGPARYVASKAPAGTSQTVTLTVKAGEYDVRVQPVTVGGRLYTAETARREITVRSGGRTDLNVRYVLVNGAYNLHATQLAQDAVSLAWEAPSGAQFALRRTPGTRPITQRSQGTAVPVNGRAAVDSNLQPATQYSYWLFTKHRGRWTGPLSVVVGTSPSAGSTDAAFVAPPSTLIARAGDIVTATPTGAGVRMQLATRVPPPLLGSAVVLPQSASLPGGFLGVVTAISADGATVDLSAAGLGDAFDYYEIDIPDFSEQAAGEVSTSSVPAESADESGRELTPKERAAEAPSASAADAGAAAAAVACSNGVSQTITYSPSIQLGGHFKAKVNTKSVLGVDIPAGASVDMSVSATITGAMALETSGSTTCSLDLPGVMRTLSAYPVPLSVKFDPVAELSIASAVKVSNIGVTVTAGVRLAGTMGLTGGASFTGSPILSASPLTPTIAVAGAIGATLGGELAVGPGAGTPDAGVIAGLGGHLNPLVAQFMAETGTQNCLSATVRADWGLHLTAKAWVPGWSASQQITVDALQWNAQYPGSPWELPDGCTQAPTPGDAVLGEGVTLVSDEVGGSTVQWGHVDGFAPGQKTWVLSTGNIADALGLPGQHASTNLEQPGDDVLSQLSGRVTYDAAYYQVTLIPTGDMLHVRYAFASEEYPEYANSSYNDVMQVLVGSTNCAMVPGTSDPVAVNTVNADRNAEYYVDNSTGASGYSTSMDGLTVPLTCSVPVIPGQPVTVRIAVADASDAIYDSAVALLDKGIWTD